LKEDLERCWDCFPWRRSICLPFSAFLGEDRFAFRFLSKMIKTASSLQLRAIVAGVCKGGETLRSAAAGLGLKEISSGFGAAKAGP
jgi:hypothetical protein